MSDMLGAGLSKGLVYQETVEPYLPPGYRFHPTDEELVVYYLANKVADCRFSVAAIAEVDLNKCEPWDLPERAKMGEKEWYFFSLKDRKYPTGLRTNRATMAGYWKATGKDREVVSSAFCKPAGHLVGMKKTLVFYKGRAPKGEKTNWIMHEYRLEGEASHLHMSTSTYKDEWVICRIFKKSMGSKITSPSEAGGFNDPSLPPLLESPYTTCMNGADDTSGITEIDQWAADPLYNNVHHGQSSTSIASCSGATYPKLTGHDINTTGLLGCMGMRDFNSDYLATSKCLKVSQSNTKFDDVSYLNLFRDAAQFNAQNLMHILEMQGGLKSKELHSSAGDTFKLASIAYKQTSSSSRPSELQSLITNHASSQIINQIIVDQETPSLTNTAHHVKAGDHVNFSAIPLMGTTETSGPSFSCAKYDTGAIAITAELLEGAHLYMNSCSQNLINDNDAYIAYNGKAPPSYMPHLSNVHDHVTLSHVEYNMRSF